MDPKTSVSNGGWGVSLPNNSPLTTCRRVLIELNGVPIHTPPDINYTDHESFETEVESMLVSEFGGTWDVVTSDSGSSFTVTSITGEGTDVGTAGAGGYEFVLDNCSGTNLAVSSIALVASETCARQAVNSELFGDPGVWLYPDGACVFTGRVELGGLCASGWADITATIQAIGGIAVVIEVYDDNENLIANATYAKTGIAPYTFCDAPNLAMTLQAGYNTGGIIDWEDAMNATWDGAG